MVAVQACAPAAATTPDVSDIENPGRSRQKVISSAEIEQSTYTNVEELIRAVRPAWLRVHPQSFTLPHRVDLYIDELPTSLALADISLSQVSRLEYLTAPEATTRFGTQQGTGAILITTKRGR
jgi:hypothetical protein